MWLIWYLAKEKAFENENLPREGRIEIVRCFPNQNTIYSHYLHFNKSFQFKWQIDFIRSCHDIDNSVFLSFARKWMMDL